MIAAFRLELRRGRAMLLWVTLVSVAYAAIITAFYPTILENAAAYEDMLKFYPKELLAAFGISGGLAEPGTFVNTYIYQFLWPLVAAILGILLATRVAADADAGWLDLPLSTPLPRVRYLAAAVGAHLVDLALLSALTVLAIVGVDLLIGPDFDTLRLAMGGVHAFAFAAAIGGVTSLLAVLLLDRARAGAVAAGILILMYLANVVAQLSTDLRELARISAFHYFDLKPLIDRGVYPLGETLLYAAVAAAGWIGAIALFRRRDLAA